MSENIEKLSRIKKDIGAVQDSIFFELHSLDQEITRLKKALEIANEAIGFYAKEDNWLFSSEYGTPSIKTEIKLDHDCQVGCSGKRAREAQKQIKEILGGSND